MISQSIRRAVWRTCVLILAAAALVACAVGGEVADGETGGGLDEDHHDEETVQSLTMDAGQVVALGLEGKLYFLQQGSQAQSLMRLDLELGMLETAFQAPPFSWLTGADVSPDGTQALLAYSPPPEAGGAQRGSTGISWISLLDLGEPQAVRQPGGANESYANPLWAPDGRMFYFSHFISDPEPTYTVARQGYPNGDVQTLIDGALWPRLSPDGRRLVYVTFQLNEDVNALRILDLDAGTGDSTPVPLPEAFSVVDAPLFTPDGGSLVFSAPVPEEPTSMNWLERVMGLQVARAHDDPADWWQVPLEGGQPVRLTQLATSGLVGDFSPDGAWFAFMSAEGLYIMRPDGSDLVQVAQGGDLLGSLDWAP